MATGDSFTRSAAESVGVPAFLVLDAESVPDGRLLARVKYPEENLAPEEAVRRAQAEARRQGAHAFDAAVAVPVQPSVYADDAPTTGSPFDGTNGLPEGLGAEQVAMPPAEDVTRV